MARLMPRKRTILGGVLAIGIAAGLYLGGKLPHLGSGFGLGQGGDSVIGQPDISDVSVKADVSGRRVSQTDEGDKDKNDGTSEAAAAPRRTDADPLDDVLTILVEGRNYSVWKKTRRGNGYFPAQLAEIVELAKSQQPNEDGVRVRILRSDSARFTAWTPLQAELVKAGIPAEEILLPKDLVKD